MVQFIRSDLDFILTQILIAEGGVANPLLQGYADPSNLTSVLPNVQVPWRLRTVDGSFNTLVFNDNPGIAHTDFAAADTVLPRSLTPTFRLAQPVAFPVPGGQPVGTPTTYSQTS